MKDVKIGKIIRGLSNEINRYVSKKINDQDGNFTMIQYNFITYIGRESLNGPVYQRDIETSFNIRRSTATGILQRLEKNGFITREASLEDGRLKHINLTKTGQELFHAKQKKLFEMEQLLVKDIPAEELAIFLKVIEKIHRNLVTDSQIHLKEHKE